MIDKTNTNWKKSINCVLTQNFNFDIILALNKLGGLKTIITNTIRENLYESKRILRGTHRRHH